MHIKQASHTASKVSEPFENILICKIDLAINFPKYKLLTKS